MKNAFLDRLRGKKRKPTEDAAAQFLAQETFWYSTIELTPGVFSPGLDLPTVDHPRQLLRRIDLTGLTCLDVGCVEGHLAVLMARRGARSVTGYDRVDWSTKVDFVQRCYDAAFEYVGGLPYSALRTRLARGRAFPFDVVNFSGVLYHMLDPVGGLLRTRALTRDGGLCLVETSALLQGEPAIYFNAEGRFLTPPNLCIPTLGWLDYILRFCRLMPLDFIHTGREGGVHPDHMRISIVCRAVAEPLVFKDGRWDNHILYSDYPEYVDWTETASSRPPIAFPVVPDHLVLRDDGTIDLFASVLERPAVPYNWANSILRLTDRS